VFTSDRGGNPQIYRLNLASKQVQRLTFSGSYNARPSWTPDGKAIIVLTEDGNGYDVGIQDLQSGRMTILTTSGNVQSPSVAPNGKMVIYADHNQGSGILGMVSTDGKVKLRVPAGDGDVQEPAWAPFSN
jgi:TolB protein